MKLIFDVDSVRPPLTGIGRYTYELARGYADRLPAEDFRLFAAGRWVRDLERRRVGSLAGPGLRRRFAALRVAGSLYRQFMPMLSGVRLRGAEDCVFHGPAYVLPPFGGRSVATVHDLSTFVHPEFHPPERVKHVEVELQRTLRQAAYLVTDSEHTRQELVSRFGWPAARVRAIPLGVSGAYGPSQLGLADTVLARLGITTGRYALYVGTIEPRKNLEVLLDAFERLPRSLRDRCPLVLAGYEGWSSSRVHARIRCAEQAGWARYLGYLDDAVLPALTAGARLFVYPSRYEGFGLPVLEAMASGVPVVASNRTSIPEVTQGAARLLDPDDVPAWSDAIRCLLEDDALASDMRARGLVVASRYSWARTVDLTLACLSEVAAGREGGE